MAGTEAGNVINGTAADDTIFGLGGNDTLAGRAGNDELHGGTGDNIVKGGPGFDTLFGDAGHDTLSLRNSDLGGAAYGGDGNDTLTGSANETASSWLEGGAGDDVLIAKGGSTALVDFDGGNDRLVGGTGDDGFNGGTGADTFVFGALWTSASGFQDTIYDFEVGIDKIDMSPSGLTFADLTIDDTGFSAIITSEAGRIEVSGLGQLGLGGTLSVSDFGF